MRTHDYTTTDGPKALQETLCVVEAALNFLEAERPGFRAGGSIDVHRARIQRLIWECRRKRPTGFDGKHDDRHTPECGCQP